MAGPAQQGHHRDLCHPEQDAQGRAIQRGSLRTQVLMPAQYWLVFATYCDVVSSRS